MAKGPGKVSLWQLLELEQFLFFTKSDKVRNPNEAGGEQKLASQNPWKIMLSSLLFVLCLLLKSKLIYYHYTFMEEDVENYHHML